MSAPIALQLYSVREALARDFVGTVEKVAQMGYTGVELAGFPGTTPQKAAMLFEKLGLQAPSGHFPMPVGDKKNETLEAAQAIGCTYVGSGFGPSLFTTLDQVKSTCDVLNEAAANVRAAGLHFLYHNHWWEFQRVDGRYVYQIMLERLHPNTVFELDTYWIKVAGVDPAAVVKELGARAPLLHIKDGPCVREQPMTAVGDGVMDIPGVVKAGLGNSQWLVVEIDRTAGDMFEAVQRSITYLVREGLGHGRT